MYSWNSVSTGRAVWKSQTQQHEGFSASSIGPAAFSRAKSSQNRDSQSSSIGGVGFARAGSCGVKNGGCRRVDGSTNVEIRLFMNQVLRSELCTVSNANEFSTIKKSGATRPVFEKTKSSGAIQIVEKSF
jgi:hypothetical protein